MATTRRPPWQVIFHQVSPEGLLIGGLAASMAPEKNNTTQAGLQGVQAWADWAKRSLRNA